MTVTAFSEKTAAVQRVYDRYDAMVRRLTFTRTASLSERELNAEIAPVLAAEARLLDARAFEQWQAMLSDEMQFWVPVHPDDHPAKDQALIYDDRRRLSERVAHFFDPQAWAVVAPDPLTIRQIGAVEAWDAGTEIVATAPIELLHVRRGAPVKLAGREILSLERNGAGFLITSKTLILPELALSTPHLGWII
jgi:3-phenylpropionate/cinnamic acid dioxygenase small subunit